LHGGFAAPDPSCYVAGVTNTAVLVLNRHYQPIHVTNVKRAFSLLYLGVARVVDPEFKTFDFDSWADLSATLTSEMTGSFDVIRTVNRAIRIPRVIVLQIYDRIPKTKVRFSRHNIYMRDGNTCQYCGEILPRTDLNLDHVVPRAQGGRTTWENVVCCCVDCNLSKGARTPVQAGLKLLKAPVRPRWTPTFRTNGGRVRYREWLPFLGLPDASYWNVELED
jgi:5-methylcytosine-specific restriction endonuclease McrA